MTVLAQVLVTADKEELNFILLNVNCAALAEVVSRITMDMLTGSGLDQRLPDLQVLARLASSRCHLTVVTYLWGRGGRGEGERAQCVRGARAYSMGG